MSFKISLNESQIPHLEATLGRLINVKRIQSKSLYLSKNPNLLLVSDNQSECDEFPYLTLQAPVGFGFLLKPKEKPSSNSQKFEKLNSDELFEFEEEVKTGNEAMPFYNTQNNKSKLKRVPRPYYKASNNYFKLNVPHLIGFFFQPPTPSSPTFSYIDLQDKSLSFNSIVISGIQKIPAHHKSVITCDGEVYLIGGINDQIAREDKRILNEFYYLSLLTKELEKMPNLLISRAHHGAVYSKLLNGIIVAGGLTYSSDSKLINTDSVEFFSFSTGEWKMLPPVHLPSIDSTLSCHSDYIYKVGGCQSSESGFERYSIIDNQWTKFRIPERHSAISSLVSPGLFSTGDQLILFGGFMHGIRSNSSFKLHSTGHNANEWVECKDSPFGGEVLTQGIQYEGEIYSIQNLSIERNEIDPTKLLIVICTYNEWEFVI